MADQQFCLRWNNHQSTLISVFDKLLESGTLADCTLAAEGQYLKAHRLVLYASSPYLEMLLSQHYEKHPIVILKDVNLSELKYIMDYMYRGEVNIPQSHLKSFLKAAESLRIKGLTENGTSEDACNVGSAQPVPMTHSFAKRTNLASESPAYRSRDGSVSPSSRKIRKIRRHSQSDNFTLDTHLYTSNSYNLPSQVQSTRIAPNIPDNVTSSITTTSTNGNCFLKTEPTEIVNRTSPLGSSGLIKENTEPSGPLLEPKAEYLEDVNTEDIVEDLTLDDGDDDNETDRTDIPGLCKPHQLYDIGVSSNICSQKFAPWQFGVDQSETGEVFMATQEAQGAHTGSRVCSGNSNMFKCGSCGKSYHHKGNLNRHQRYECGDKRPFACSLCPFATKQKNSLQLHMFNNHMKTNST